MSFHVDDEHDIAATFVPRPGTQHEVNGLSPPILLRIAMGYGARHDVAAPY